MRRTLLAAALAGLVVLSAAVGARGQATPGVQSRTPGDTTWLSRYAGWTVWSEKVAGRYTLFARSGGATKLLPAPPGAITQDPGTGRGPTGRPTAVYQRCTKASCEIWAIDLASGEQRKVAGLGKIRRGKPSATNDDLPGLETHPRIWGDRVAFQTGASDKAAQLRVGPSASGRGTLKTLPGRPRKEGFLTQLALGPKHVVGLWEDDFCFGGCVGLYIDGIASGRQQQLDAGAAGEVCITVLDGVLFDGRAFRWTRELTAEDSSDTTCTSKVTRVRYDPVAGRKTSS